MWKLQNHVIDVLQPHTNLTTLTISHYGGSHFPSWVGDPLFSNMVVLRIVGCEKCTSLPSLGVLSSLKDLTICGLTGFRIIGQEFYGNGYSMYFPSLETLHLENLPNWNRWDCNDHDQTFQVLCELSIINCSSLFEGLPDHLPSLQKLVIQQCAEIAFSTSRFPNLYNLKVDGCKEMVYTPAADFGSINFMTHSIWLIQGFQKAEHLRIEKCPTLTSLLHVMKHNACLDHLVIEGCHSLTCIVMGHLPSTFKRLEIRNCGPFQCLLGDGKGKGTNNLSSFSSEISHSSLEHLSISHCHSFHSLSSGGQLLEALKYLEIQNCSQILTLASMQLPQNLKHLEVFNCQNLEALSSAGPLPESLEQLYIYNCPITTLQSTGDLPASLQHLNIQFCTKLETLSSGQFPERLKRLKSIPVKNLFRYLKACTILEIVVSLRQMSVKVLLPSYGTAFPSAMKQLFLPMSLKILQPYQAPRTTSTLFMKWSNKFFDGRG